MTSFDQLEIIKLSKNLCLIEDRVRTNLAREVAKINNLSEFHAKFNQTSDMALAKIEELQSLLDYIEEIKR